MATPVVNIKDLVDLKDILSIDSVSNTRLIINENFHKLRRGLLALVDLFGGGDITNINISALGDDIVANSFSTNLSGPPYNFRVDSQGVIVSRSITVLRSTETRLNFIADPTTGATGPGEIRFDGSDLLFWDGGTWISLTAGAAGGEVTDGANVGTGIGVWYDKNSLGGGQFELRFQSLKAGANVTITNTTPGEIVIAAAGTSGTSGTAGTSGWSGYSGYSGKSGWSGYSGYSGASGTSGSGVSGYSGWSGYAGASGWSGLNGAAASSGFSGYSGYSGVSGSGISGYSGYSGHSGVSGRGISGYSGYSGVSGSGISGYSGYSGFSSTSGFSGFSGKSGWSGYSGYSGVSGGTGPTGASGAPGPTGAPGTSGWSGYSGYSGKSGWSGSGISGWSGYSGYSGWSGWSGAQGSPGVASTSITWAALVALTAAGTVVIGKAYHIIDLTEPLVVTGVGPYATSTLAMSPSYPRDIIYYHLATNRILYREDPLYRLSAYYDWRTVKFRRWEFVAGNGLYTAWTDPGGGALYQDFYTFGNDFNTTTVTYTPAANGNGGNCRNIRLGPVEYSLWSRLDNNVVFGDYVTDVEFAGDVVYGNVENSNVRLRIGEMTSEFFVKDSIDSLTIGRYNNLTFVGAGCVDVRIGDYGQNVIVYGSNAGISIGGSFTGTIGTNNVGIHIGERVQGLTIGDSNNSSVLSAPAIVIGDNTNNVTIGDDNENITVGNSCEYVAVGNSNISIQFDSETTYITVGDSCTNLRLSGRWDAIGVQQLVADSTADAYLVPGRSTLSMTLDMSDGAIYDGVTLSVPDANIIYGEFLLTSGNSTEDLTNIATASYTATLMKHHPIRLYPQGNLRINIINTAASTATTGSIITEGANPYIDGNNLDWIEFDARLYGGSTPWRKTIGANYA